MNERTIDHEQAIKEMMAERYLLHELKDADRDAYEAHLFECQPCFEQIRAGAEFVDYIKRFGAEETARAATKEGFMGRLLAGLRQPVAAYAMVLLIIAPALNLYQLRDISRQKEPTLERSYMLTGIVHGGVSGKFIQVPRNSRLGLSVEYTPRGEFTSYSVRIVSDSGVVKSNLPLALDQVDGVAKVAVPAGSLAPGKYSIVVAGRNSDGVENEIGRGSFELQYSD